jgi:hypothetical protein
MAKTTADLKRLIQLVMQEIERELPTASMRIATDAKALCERRIKEKGFGPVYSDYRVPAFFLADSTLNNKGKTFLNRKKTKRDGTNWKELRAAQGLQAKFVDLSYSNEMWSGMGVVRTERSGDSFVSHLGSNNKSAQQKMDWNFARYGDFIMEVLEEDGNIEIFARVADAHVSNILKKILG